MKLPWLAVGAGLAGLGVALGAFGAHGLKERVTPRDLEVFETAVRYQLFHALALVALGTLQRATPALPVDGAGTAFLVGILVFSGSLYALVGTGQRWLGAITPLGGIAFLAGWALLTWAALRR